MFLWDQIFKYFHNTPQKNMVSSVSKIRLYGILSKTCASFVSVAVIKNTHYE